MESKVFLNTSGASRIPPFRAPAEEKPAASRFEFFPSSSSSPLKNLSYELVEMSAFLELSSLARFIGVSNKLKQRLINSNRLWKPFLNPEAQSKISMARNEKEECEQEGLAYFLFRNPENRDVKYLTCDEAGRTYLSQLQETLQAYPNFMQFFRQRVQEGTVNNALIEVAKKLPTLPSEHQKKLNTYIVYRFISEGRLNIEQALAVTPEQVRVFCWYSLYEPNLQRQNITLTLEEALSLTAEERERLSVLVKRDLFFRMALSEEETLMPQRRAEMVRLTQEQLERLRLSRAMENGLP